VDAGRQALTPEKCTGFFTKLLKKGAKKLLSFDKKL
jgi:hypothetical protein